MTGVLHHLLLTLRLNFRGRQAIVYGYVVPVLFLLAFGSVFRSGQPMLLAQMGQILTITILGGACLGFPTALVAERERGVWRRYRLLPVSTGALLLSTMVVRLAIVALAVLIQIGLARLIYGTPFPQHLLQLVLAFLVVSAAFLGLGLVVTALAGDVPAVQALGQCLFLPMIMIGGVGVPLAVLPEWAQAVASFMPGRYAVEVLQPCFNSPHGLGRAGFAIGALVVMGGAAAFVGVRLFRWDNSVRLDRRAKLWSAAALLGWIAVGSAAALAGRLGPATMSGEESYADITPAQIDAITYENLPEDDGIYTPLAPPSAQGRRLPPRLAEFVPRLATWGPGNLDDDAQSVRNLLCVAAIADISQDLAERDIARTVFEHLRSKYDREQLSRALAWVILSPDAGTVVVAAPELALRGEMHPDIVRQRCGWYARKFLGRILGKIPDEPVPGR